MILVDVSENLKEFVLTFRYRPELVELVKTIPGRKWNPTDKRWTVPVWPETISELKKLVISPTPKANELLTAGHSTSIDTKELEEIKNNTNMISAEFPPLWEHQKNMIAWGLSHKASLWHCGMGTGKSRATIDMIQTEGYDKVLIACPLAVIPAWKKQIDTFSVVPMKCVALNKGSVKKKKEQAMEQLSLCQATGVTCVIVINYESLWREPFSLWAYQKWPLIVWDELQALKAPGGKASRFCHHLSRMAKKIVGLSGTPLPHSPLDAYGVYRSIDDSIFGTSFTRFRARYAIMGGFENKQVVAYQNQDEMTDKLNSIRIHVTRDVLDLPDAVHIDQSFDLPAKTLLQYKELEKEFYLEVGDGTVTASNALTRLLRLQQITSGHLPLDRILPDGSNESIYLGMHEEKANQLRVILDGLDHDEPVVVFCRFRKDIEVVHNITKELGRTSKELSGQLKQLEEWQNGEAQVLAAQIRTGREGVDFTRSCYCIYYSLGFSLGDYEQSLARTHRPGQTRTVFYYHLIAEHTVDRKIYKALKEKKNIIDSILTDKN